MHAYAPTGARILGTLERLTARAEIAEDSFARLPNGKIYFEHEGGTELFYDDMTTETRDGEMVFLDDAGHDWTSSQLILQEGEEFDEEKAVTSILEEQRRRGIAAIGGDLVIQPVEQAIGARRPDMIWHGLRHGAGEL